MELPENGPEVASGTQVKKPSDKNWDETKINSFADGTGNTIPVPVGFTPIQETEGQGTKDTGFVIRDTSTNEDGSPSETNGNEFVWIPVEGKSYTYDRYAFTREDWSYTQTKGELDSVTNSYKINAGSSYDYTEAMPQDEQASVSQYGGYYIGRYEAGIEGYTDLNTTKDGTTTWTGYTGGKLVVQKGKKVWNYITRDRAKTEAERLYNKEENNVKSKLISSYGWDTALKFIETQNSTYPTNSDGGYYGQSRPTTTGNNTIYPCNIYDMGGNVYEWTTETYSSGSFPCPRRGGGCDGTASSYPAAGRYGSSTTSADAYIAFRVTLYM